MEQILLFIGILGFTLLASAKTEPNMPRIGKDDRPSALRVAIDNANLVHPQALEEASSKTRPSEYEVPFRTAEVDGGAAPAPAKKAEQDKSKSGD